MCRCPCVPLVDLFVNASSKPVCTSVLYLSLSLSFIRFPLWLFFLSFSHLEFLFSLCLFLIYNSYFNNSYDNYSHLLEKTRAQFMYTSDFSSSLNKRERLKKNQFGKVACNELLVWVNPECCAWKTFQKGRFVLNKLVDNRVLLPCVQYVLGFCDDRDDEFSFVHSAHKCESAKKMPRKPSLLLKNKKQTHKKKIIIIINFPRSRVRHDLMIYMLLYNSVRWMCMWRSNNRPWWCYIIENCCQSLQLFGNARVQQDVFVDSRKKKHWWVVSTFL